MSFCFSIRDLLKFKEEVTKERDQLLSEVVKLREALAQSTEQQQETERNREDAEQTITQVSLRLSRAPRRNSAEGCPSPGSLPFSFLFDVYLLGPKESIHHSAHFFLFFLTGAIFVVTSFSTLCWKSVKQGHTYNFSVRKCSGGRPRCPASGNGRNGFFGPF